MKLKRLQVTVLVLVGILTLTTQSEYDENSRSEPPEEQASDGTFESDIKLTPEQMAAIYESIQENENGVDERKAHAILARRWPKGIIPYEISPESEESRFIIRWAMHHWSNRTCIKFEPYSPSKHFEDLGHRNRIVFVKENGCWSYVGMLDLGAQKISIGRGCNYFGTIVHEIGHAIGFWHEQSRPDRDDYIVIHKENIVSGMEHNFEKYDTGRLETYHIPYDCDSIMHYGRKYFSKNREATISAKNPDDCHGIGQRYGLSPIDIQLARFMYDCD
ncbi:blastula protease 10-like [Ptychodera flava]|uniref:blastula protease 10-like n=1 Tax=Ptychodera flava TaxID=63121 RepID=UPI00396AA6D3